MLEIKFILYCVIANPHTEVPKKSQAWPVTMLWLQFYAVFKVDPCSCFWWKFPVFLTLVWVWTREMVAVYISNSIF